MAREKLTQEMVDLAIQYKGEGCTNGDIICMLGVAESTFYRWTCHPRGKLQRALSEGLKKAEGQFKRTMITTIGNAALASVPRSFGSRRTCAPPEKIQPPLQYPSAY